MLSSQESSITNLSELSRIWSRPSGLVERNDQRRRQGLYWIITIPIRARPEGWDECPEGVRYFKGQKETGEETGYEHWQALVCLEEKGSIFTMQRIFGQRGHYELSRSNAANDYVWKEATRVEGSQFEFGRLPFKRNSQQDWDQVWEWAKEDQIELIPAQIRVQHYRTLEYIAAKYCRPVGREKLVHVYWGSTGTGKSKTAWDEATLEAYPKDPRSKFWDGYRGQRNVVIDEFRGAIDISHILRWLDRYPVIVEVKGASTVLRPKEIWITSNLHPRDWYPGLDPETYQALERRLEIKEFV